MEQLQECPGNVRRDIWCDGEGQVSFKGINPAGMHALLGGHPYKATHSDCVRAGTSGLKPAIRTGTAPAAFLLFPCLLGKLKHLEIYGLSPLFFFSFLL